MGSEPRSIGDRSWFDLEEEAGLVLMRSLDDAQRAKAQIYPSITKADMPDPDLQNPFDGRQVGGMGQDNSVIPYQGVPATDLSDAQRRLLLEVARCYTGWIRRRARRGVDGRDRVAPRRHVVLVVRRLRREPTPSTTGCTAR